MSLLPRTTGLKPQGVKWSWVAIVQGTWFCVSVELTMLNCNLIGFVQRNLLFIANFCTGILVFYERAHCSRIVRPFHNRADSFLTLHLNCNINLIIFSKNDNTIKINYQNNSKHQHIFISSLIRKETTFDTLNQCTLLYWFFFSSSRSETNIVKWSSGHRLFTLILNNFLRRFTDYKSVSDSWHRFVTTLIDILTQQ